MPKQLMITANLRNWYFNGQGKLYATIFNDSRKFFEDGAQFSLPSGVIKSVSEYSDHYIIKTAACSYHLDKASERNDLGFNRELLATFRKG